MLICVRRLLWSDILVFEHSIEFGLHWIRTIGRIHDLFLKNTYQIMYDLGASKEHHSH